MEELHAIVSGRVQMVLFRDFTQRRARRYGLAGFVRNLEDGTVEVVAQGERAALEKFLADLRAGPLLAKVEQVALEWRRPARHFGAFEMIG